MHLTWSATAGVLVTFHYQHSVGVDCLGSYREIPFVVDRQLYGVINVILNVWLKAGEVNDFIGQLHAAWLSGTVDHEHLLAFPNSRF